MQYSGTTQITVVQIILEIRTLKSGTATISQIEPYTIDLQIPFTNSQTGEAQFYGDSYDPYKSHVFTCTNSFTYSSTSSLSTIDLSNPSLTAESSGYYGSLSFDA